MKQNNKLNDREKKQFRLSLIIFGVVFIMIILYTVNVLGADTKEFKDQKIVIKDKEKINKQVDIKQISKVNDDLTITLNQGGYTMYELYQIKIATEKIVKEKTNGKTIIKIDGVK